MNKIFEQLLRVRDFGAGFLCPKYEETIEPELMPDMQEAVKRIRQAREQGEKVLIYGDYDVDGVTASTVMSDTLKLTGVEVAEIMLPNRFADGYGMSKKVVQRVQELGVKLVVTVDCGSRNHEIIQELSEAGVDTIVTDHHECSETLPGAVAVVNAKRRDVMQKAQKMRGGELREGDLEKLEELRELAGVGVAFKLAQALVQEGMIPEGQEKWLLDLVLIGTVCDSMRLLGENRRFCYYGMKVLEKTRRPGLKELLRTAKTKKLDGEAIGFQIGPRLNAAGRMDTAEKALNLLMAKNRPQAAQLAMELESLNQERKKQQQAVLDEIRERGVGDEPVLIELGEWHEGILGIVAGRLVEEFHRPAFVLSEVDGVLKGSGRSFGDFNLAEALAVCDKYIIGGGGHAEACGVKIDKTKIEDFRKAMWQYYDNLELKDQERFLGVQEDLVVEDFADFSLELIEDLGKLEPYGNGNAEPMFLLPEVRVRDVAKLGDAGQHLRLTVEDMNGKDLKLMCFYAPEEYLTLQSGEMVNAWINLSENEFRGIRSVEGRIVKLARA